MTLALLAQWQDDLDPAQWLEDLLPGAYVVVVCPWIVYHRFTCRLEGIGFRIVDCIASHLAEGLLLSCLAQKPVEGTIAANCLKYGCGGLNIGACRIPARHGDYDHSGNKEQRQSGAVYGWAECKTKYVQCPPDPGGRFPANITFDASMGGELDRQSGKSQSRKYPADTHQKRQDNKVYGKGLGTMTSDNSYDDDGGASRFFFVGSLSDTLAWLQRLISPPGCEWREEGGVCVGY